AVARSRRDSGVAPGTSDAVQRVAVGNAGRARRAAHRMNPLHRRTIGQSLRRYLCVCGGRTFLCLTYPYRHRTPVNAHTPATITRAIFWSYRMHDCPVAPW